MGSDRNGSIPITSDRTQFERFLELVQKAHKKRGLNEALAMCVSMLAVVQSFMIASVGRDEAQKLLTEFIDEGFQRTRPQ